jgi:hypothetical protein
MGGVIGKLAVCAISLTSFLQVRNKERNGRQASEVNIDGLRELERQLDVYFTAKIEIIYKN